MPNPIQSALRAAAEAGVAFIAAYNRRRLPKVDSPFLVGIHVPMPAELTLDKLDVTGTIPAGLEGRLRRVWTHLRVD